MSASTPVSNIQHARVRVNMDRTQAVHDFLEFCRDKGLELGWIDPRTDDFPPREDALLYEWIDVNPKALEAEKVAMINAQHEANDAYEESVKNGGLKST